MKFPEKNCQLITPQSTLVPKLQSQQKCFTTFTFMEVPAISYITPPNRQGRGARTVKVT